MIGDFFLQNWNQMKLKLPIEEFWIEQIYLFIID